jgi:hypothetical protein
VKLQSRYGYTVFLSINITRSNLEDVRLLTEFGRENGIGTAYHLCESSRGNAAFQSEELGPVDELLDYLIGRNRAGYSMVNSTEHLRAMKSLLRGGVAPWPCRGGQNMVICRTDGTLAPCYPMRESEGDWGSVGCEKFDTCQLGEMKQQCSASCFSTVGYMLANYYDMGRAAREVSAQVIRRLGSAMR